jgi:hypothetical protein
MAEDFLDKFTKLPEGQGQEQNTGATETSGATETQTTQATDTGGQTQQANTGTATATTTTTTVVPDKFIEDFNKRYSTSFKADDELRTVLGMPQKIGELEGKAKLSEEYAQKVEDYKKQIEEYKNNGNSEFLSKPLVRKAYIAEQLLAKYPDKDPFTLQEIVMADVDKMGDLDVLIKEQKISFPDYSEEDHKASILKAMGVDPETNPKDWDSITKLTIAKSAFVAREKIKALTTGIELPKTVTKEEREQAVARTMQERTKALEPHKAKFTTFDKFKHGDFEFDSTSDFKSRLGESFDNMFLRDGLEPTPENLQLAEEMRDAQFLFQNFDKIREVIAKQAQTEIQKKLDEALHNTQPPNTATATDESGQSGNLPGLSKFLEDNR